MSIYITHILFRRKGLVDKINSRSSHSSIATRSGGIGIFIVVFCFSLIHYVQGIDLFEYSLLVPLSLLLIVGLYDDIYQLDIKLKFIFQIIAAKIFIDNGLLIDNLHGFLGIYELNRIIAQGLSIFIIVAIINSINFIDGIDGLAVSLVILFIVCFELFKNSYSPNTHLSIIIISSLLPISLFNFKKTNKVFLGDSGSLFLGGLVSVYVIYILTNDYIIKPRYDLHKILFVISILLYPIVDIVRIVFIRILKGKSPFKADKNHLHHLLLKKTKNHFYTTLIIISISIFFIILIKILF